MFRTTAWNKDIADKEFRDAVRQIQQAPRKDRLGPMYKKRLAHTDTGRSGGSRAYAVVRAGEDYVFYFAFPKNDRENVTNKEEKLLKEQAKDLSKLTDEGIENAINGGVFIPIEWLEVEPQE